MSKRTIRTFLPPVCTLLFAATSFAATLTGTVTDRTTGKPSSGDTVGVINTAQSMDEVAKATSNGQGKFQVEVPDGGQILLHITHAGAEYFKSVAPGSSSVDIDVFDSAAKITGITGEALVLRAETDSLGKTLNVAENFFVQNSSTPPKTEYGGDTFEFYLPKGAQVLQTLASAPGGLPTNTPVKTLDAANGHYAFTFPIRPGETRFQVAYTLAYSGTQAFSIKLSVPTGDVAVMLPKSMQFQPTSQFQAINPDPNSQSYDAHEPPVAQPVVFALAGTGQLPQEQSQASGGQQAGAGGGRQAQPTTGGARPGGGLGAPDDPDATNDPWSKYRWWIIGALGLALAAGAGVMLKKGPVGVGAVAAPLPVVDAYDPISPGAYAAVPAPAVSSGVAPMIQALKDELFELEADRVRGRLTEAQYAEQKAAYDVVLRRTLGRIEGGSTNV